MNDTPIYHILDERIKQLETENRMLQEKLEFHELLIENSLS